MLSLQYTCEPSTTGYSRLYIAISDTTVDGVGWGGGGGGGERTEIESTHHQGTCKYAVTMSRVYLYKYMTM